MSDSDVQELNAKAAEFEAMAAGSRQAGDEELAAAHEREAAQYREAARNAK